MHFIGLDLAWGLKNQSGIAVLDAEGALVGLGVGHDDDHLVTTLRPSVADECVVAVDAPLIVHNATGRRRAEAELSADFGPFDAGAYPANTTLPVFAAGSRGARIADALGLEITPCAKPRRAIEVYPHSATISLFRLGRTLKYKAGRGRSVEDRKTALLRLMALIVGLGDATPPLRVSCSPGWPDLRDAVGAATRPFQLDRAEDPIDAVICGYVAMYAHRRPDDVVTYGDVDTGFIVTPALPPDLEPTPRASSPDVNVLRESRPDLAAAARSRS
ncbi:MAG: DUF429 domain-containing protein [Mycobacterium sp.]